MSKPTQMQPGDGLLVVDVQNDFCPGGALPIEDGDAVVEALNPWIESARELGVALYFSRDWHPQRHVSFRSEGGDWPPHCIQDSLGAAFHPDLLVPEEALVVTKGVRLDQDQNSAFDQTGLAVQLERDGVNRLWVGGLAEDVCVQATVLDGLAAGLAVRVLLFATRATSQEGSHKAREAMQAAGAHLEDKP